MDIWRIIMNIDKYVIIKGKRIDIACHTLLGMIFAIVVLGIVSTPIAFAAVYKNPVESSTFYIIIGNVDSPWNGEASYARKVYFYWKFGSLVSDSREVSLEVTISAQNGVNAYNARLADVTVYDVYAYGGNTYSKLETSMKYYNHVVLVNQSGKILDEKTVELEEPPVKPPVKKVELVSVAVGNGTYLLIPKVKDLDKVRAATLRIWLFNSYNIVLPQDKKLDPDLVLNALNSKVTVVEKLGKAVMVVLHVEYVDGSNDSYLYIAAGYDISVS